MTSKAIKDLEKLPYLQDIIKKVSDSEDRDLECLFAGLIGTAVVNNIRMFSHQQLKEMFTIAEYYIKKGGSEAAIMAAGFSESFINGYNRNKMTFDLEDILGDETKDFIEVYFNNKFNTRNRDKYKK